MIGSQEHRENPNAEKKNLKRLKLNTNIIDSDNSQSFHFADDLSHIQMENQWDSIHRDSIIHEQGINIISPKENMTKTIQFFDEKKPVELVTKKFQQEKPVKVSVTRVVRDCAGCGSHPLVGPCYQCVDCGDIFLCYNCHIEKEFKHIVTHRFKLIDEDNLTASRFLEGSRAENGNRPRTYSGRQLNKLNLNAGFDNINIDELVKDGEKFKIKVLIKNNAETSFPQDTVLKSTSLQGSFVDLKIGTLLPNSRMTEYLYFDISKQEEKNYEYRLHCSAVGYFGPFLKVSLSTTPPTPSGIRTKATVRCIEEIYKEGDLVKTSACVKIEGADMTPSVTDAAIVFNNQALMGKYDFQNTMTYDGKRITNQKGFFGSIIQGVIDALKVNNNSIVFCHRVQDKTPSFLIEGSAQLEEPGLIRRCFEKLQEIDTKYLVEFACFKIDDANVYDVIENHTIKPIKQKRYEEKFIVENLCLTAIKTPAELEKLFAPILKTRLEPDKSLHYAYLFNVYKHADKKKAPRNSLVFVDLATDRHLKPAEEISHQESDQLKKIHECYAAMKQLFISLADPLYKQKGDFAHEKLSPLSTLFRQYLMTNASVHYTFEIWPHSSYQREVKDALILSNQLRKAKRQI